MSGIVSLHLWEVCTLHYGGRRGAYNAWYTAPPHVGGCVPLIIVVEREDL